MLKRRKNIILNCKPKFYHMTPIETKALQEVLKTLQSYDSYVTYRSLLDKLNKHSEIEDALKSQIMTVHQESMKPTNNLIHSAKEWIEVLLKDQKI